MTNILQLVDVDILFLLYIKILLYFCGDIEIIPGPKRSSLTFCQWNLNCVAAHEFIKVSLLQGYITQHNLDIICLSETFLNSSLDSKDDRLEFEGYNLIRSDHSVDHEIDTLTSSAGYKQIINKPTHVISNSSSCIDLIFSNNFNLL